MKGRSELANEEKNGQTNNKEKKLVNEKIEMFIYLHINYTPFFNV